MKRTIALLTTLLILTGISVKGQYSIIGSNICADGNQTTRITLTDYGPSNLYALFKDGQLMEAKQMAKDAGSLYFSNVQEVGEYKVYEFSSNNASSLDPANGNELGGSVSVYPVPYLEQPNPITLKSGASLNFMPKANIPGTTVNWFAKKVSGQVEGFTKNGNGPVEDTLTNKGTVKACIIYTLFPQGPAEKGGCQGEAIELKVWVLPK